MSEIIIRHSEKCDSKAIQEIFSGEIAYSGTLQLPFPSLSIWEQRLENIAQDGYSLVAEVEGEVVGQIALILEKKPRRKHVAGFGMGVKDAYQRRGVGSKLVAAAIDLAENWLNIQRLELVVYTDNEAAVKLYKKHNFVIEGESPKYAFRNGEYVSVYHMARVK